MSHADHQPPAEPAEAPFDPNKTIRPLDRVFTGEGARLEEKQAFIKAKLREERDETRARAGEVMPLGQETEKRITKKVFTDHIEKARDLINLLIKRQKDPEAEDEATEEIHTYIGDVRNNMVEQRRINNTLMQGLSAIEILCRKFMIDFRNQDSSYGVLMRLSRRCKILNYGEGRKAIHLMSKEEISDLDYLIRNMLIK